MATRIGLISDLHATVTPVQEAFTIFRKVGVDLVLCAGDIAGYGEELDQTVALLVENGCTAIRGNHEVWYLENTQDEQKDPVHRFFRSLPFTLEMTIENKRMYVVHASPPCSCMDGIRLLDEYGKLKADEKKNWTERLANFDFDLLVVGHTHQVFAERLGDTLVVNPGSTKFNHTCAVLTFPELVFQVFPLGKKVPVRSWNWGTNQLAGSPFRAQ